MDTSPFNAHEFARRWKDVWTGDVDALERDGAAQKANIEGASEAWFAVLIGQLPAKTLWTFLNPKPRDDFNSLRTQMRAFALRGFQQTPNIVRHGAVQKRLAAWLEKHREVAHVLLLLWQHSAPDIARGLDLNADEEELLAFVKRIGPSQAQLVAALCGSAELLERIEKLDLEDDDSPGKDEIAPLLSPSEPQAQDPEADSDAAHFWREQAQQLESELDGATRELNVFREQNSELETLRERLRASTKELERVKKEERQKQTAQAKRFELAQKAAQSELLEIKKHDERETRRLHAAQRERDEFEMTIRVLKKQVRHLNQLLDTQAKHIASLEAQLQKQPDKNQTDAQAVDAVSTPQTTQENANKPVKVARPTPLDELFIWMADGHEFRATPREVMRAIDRNDEGFAFRTQLALEGIAPADLPKKNAFLARLREQDPYYTRVLLEPAQRALVDASNVVRATKNKRGKGELRNLLGMKTELRRLGFFPIEFIADASLRYNVDNINAYNEMINRGEVEVTTPGVEADEVLVRKARNGGGYVVTNDGKFHFKVSPDLAPPSISFRVYDGTVIVDDF